MKVAVKIIYPDRRTALGYLSTEHAMSSHGLPVLTDAGNQAMEPADLPPGTVIRVPNKHLLFAEGARLAGYTVEE